MTALGFAFLVAGIVLVVAEAHVAGGFLGVAGGLALIAGGIILILELGGGAAVAVPIGVGMGIAVGAGALLVAHKAAAVRRTRIKAGAEALCGHLGVVRTWNAPSGQVFVDGALWRARQDWAPSDEPELQEGESIVVERVNGLTLSVRRAEDWELIA